MQQLALIFTNELFFKELTVTTIKIRKGHTWQIGAVKVAKVDLSEG